ncbi:galactose-1-phosphate uridylyltransferase [Mycolicibacterium chlorophenolicum]|uniref:Galactose-1-phosphate uridylyltransferase n=1 Tax=Mycolicibacterium chlorophenolicum TaxID=37916 RepID=A0A0J6V7S3_9MYCO|nr:galactose-1-phosphate uridylyltransferase [Mycolicibacterium chlorophenolicum]KMO66890.1 Galactose-1-phosphate uridylyltransferase [Mycolicibacterium chlorophenolicum]
MVENPSRTDAVTSWTLADGRDLLFFSLPVHEPAPVPDLRPLPPRSESLSELRFDQTTGQWVIVAPARQDRTYLPPRGECPLCPGPSGLTSEIPAPDYDVVVFENRFASLSGGDVLSSCSVFDPVPGSGRCEVICFSSDHDSSFASLDPAQARLVVEAWRHRTFDLMNRPGISQVFCFENRGEEIGVTLTHPHGQIYGYPFVTPRTQQMLRQAALYRERHGSNLFGDLVTREVEDGRRIVLRDSAFTALVPFAARWPVEVHIYPNRFVHSLLDLSAAELDAFSAVYQEILRRLDRMYDAPLPYMAGLHQYPEGEGCFHVEIISTRRTADKLKYLASSESIMDAFINDVVPEALAERLRSL